MPFNAAIAGSGGISYTLFLGAESLNSAYDVEGAVVQQYGQSTLPGDTVKLTVAAVNIVAANTSLYAIDGDGLNDLASLEIRLVAGCFISGRGGDGGRGGVAFWEPEFGTAITGAGDPGEDGGTAIRLGCPTRIRGSGLISRGHAGGGGGAGYAISFNTEYGGGGGGGGAPFGVGGTGGAAADAAGNPGTTASITLRGSGGSSSAPDTFGDGGDGGESSVSAEAGEQGSEFSGGAAGTNGNAIETQGFSLDVVDVVIEGGIV